MLSLYSPRVDVFSRDKACTVAAPSNTLASKCDGASGWTLGSMQSSSSYFACEFVVVDWGHLKCGS